jgi:5-methylthioadenosine/S-adenosylhomocysteine deaminase
VNTPAAAPRPVDLLIEAAWVLPVEPHGVVLSDHAVAVDGDAIVSLLPIDAARARFAPRRTVRLGDHVLMPGLVNAHTHNPMTLMRGLADDLPLMQWLQEHVWPAEARAMGPDFVRDGVELAVAEMLRGGTTTCSENYFFPDVIADTYRGLGFRALVGLPVIEFPSAWARSRDEYFDKATEVHDRFRRDPLVSTCFAPHAPYTVSDASFARIRVLSDQLDVPVHLHLHETAQECDDSRREHGVRPIQRIQGLGLLNDALIAVHMTQLTDAEIDACARAGVRVVHCPESNLKLASGFCPVAKLLAAGVTVGLGTDGCASNNDLDMIGELRTAALLAKGVSGDPRALDAASALRMATLGSARAIGLGARIGSIEAGKQADLVALRLDEVESMPIYHLASQLAYAGNRRQVTDVWIAGRHKLAEGMLVDLDVAALRAKARRWQGFLAGNA